MKKVFVFLTIGVAVYGASCNDNKSNHNSSSTSLAAEIAKPMSKPEQINRGEYLVAIMGCGDCHSPKKMTPQGPVPDENRILSGFNSTEPIPTFDATVMQRDKVMLFSGQLTSFSGPWGTSFAANLTPDDTGIGNWTIDNFKKAIKNGKFKGMDNGRSLLPPMPWQNFQNIKDEDAEAIFAYLKSLKPINNKVPNAIPPSVANAKM